MDTISLQNRSREPQYTLHVMPEAVGRVIIHPLGRINKNMGISEAQDAMVRFSYSGYRNGVTFKPFAVLLINPQGITIWNDYCPKKLAC